VDTKTGMDEATGSNAIAIHPSRTETGEAYLAINSHQPLEGPVAWYEAHLQSEEGWNILGGLFPGGMTIFHGVNEHLGWAHTVNFPDKLDVFQLKQDITDNLAYQVDGEWLELEEKTVWLWVRIWDMINVPIPKKVWKSIYGPTLVTNQGAFSIRTGALMDITAPQQWYQMNKARNFSEFFAAMSTMKLTGFNTVYADKYDTIYYVSNALLPIRPENIDFSGTVVGDTREVLWTNFHPYADLPQQLNPSSGYLYNTNHSPFKASALADNLDPDVYPKSMGFKKNDNNRSIRFREIMPDTGLLSYQQFKNIKFDRTLPQILAYEMDINGLFEIKESEYPELKDQIRTLNTWDKTANIESEGAGLFAFIYYYIRDKYEGETAPEKLVIEDAIEAMEASKIYFQEHFQSDIVPLGTYQKLVRGDKELPLSGLVDVISAMRSEPYADGKRKGAQGESYIMMVRFGAGLPTIETVNVYGASSQASSSNYDDQMELFTNQKLKSMTLNKDSVIKNAVRIYEPKR
jgi:acyl-homoserine-lactone acylase